MAEKKNPETSRFHIEGGIHANRDVIMGDQHNYGARDERVVQITSVDEFWHALADLQTQFTALKQGQLSTVQTVLVETAEKKTAEAAEESKKPTPDGSKVTKTLHEVQEAFDALKGGLASAVGLGATLANVIAFAVKYFGG